MRARKTLIAVSAALIMGLLAAPSASSAGSGDPANPFGLMFSQASTRLADLATTLGASNVRRLVTLGSWTGSCSGCRVYSDEGLAIVLTVRNSSSGSLPSSAPPSLDVYRSRVGEVLDSVNPRVLVVENEETVAQFYTGSASQYHSQLQASCSEAHERGIKCANGGLPNPHVILMTYFHYLDLGQDAKADSYLRRSVLTEEEYEFNSNPYNESKLRAKVNGYMAFLNGYRAAGADYVNFHWYRADAQAFAETVQFLQGATGLPAISNEIGQYVDSGSQIRGIMQQVTSLGLDYAIWFSEDRYVKAQNRWISALHNSDYSLRPHGVEYQRMTAGFQPGGTRTVSIAVAPKGLGMEISGRVSGSTGCTSGQVVKLEAKSATGSFQVVAQTTSDASGAYSFSRGFKGRTGNVKASLPATTSCTRAESPVVSTLI